MLDAVELAGYFCAHAVWCVADGETLVPILGFQNVDGTQSFRRLEGPELTECVAEGKAWLTAPPREVAVAVLIYDGFISLPDGKTDALLLDMHSYVSDTAAIQMALPYRHAAKQGGFAVHKPKILAFSGVEPNWEAVVEALFSGVAQHQKGAEIWNATLDESR
jgi:hypothetical protein